MAGAIGVRAQPNRADGTYTYKEGSNSINSPYCVMQFTFGSSIYVP